MTRPAAPREHGTNRGYHQHNRRGEVPCGPCLAAHSARELQARRGGRCAAGLGWPLEVRRG